MPETLKVKSDGFLMPPLLLSTLVMTFKKVMDPGVAPVYLLEIVQSTGVPPLAVPEHPEE